MQSLQVGAAGRGGGGRGGGGDGGRAGGGGGGLGGRQEGMVLRSTEMEQMEVPPEEKQVPSDAPQHCLSP